MIHPHDFTATAQDEPCAAVLQTLDKVAAEEEAGTSPIADSIAQLRRAGWLADDGTEHPALTVQRLARVGAANLPVGRLWEGHMNALYLARVHAGAEISNQVSQLVAKGALLGVWGADGEIPVTATGNAFTGKKIYASGLGTLTHAVITVESGPQVRLALIDVGDPRRADHAKWTMQGMRATASGGFDVTGLSLTDALWLGQPGDYLKEPHFIGGVWRIAALQVGAAFGILEVVARELRARNRLDAPAQMARLSAAGIQGLAATALVTQAACTAAMDGAAHQAATLSAAARLASEDFGLNAIKVTEQCLGLAHFAAGSDSGRKARDLSVYMRQAARDAFAARIGEAMYAQEGALWRLI